MELSFKHLDALITLLFGVNTRHLGIAGFVKQRHIFVMVLSLSRSVLCLWLQVFEFAGIHRLQMALCL